MVNEELDNEVVILSGIAGVVKGIEPSQSPACFNVDKYLKF